MKGDPLEYLCQICRLYDNLNDCHSYLLRLTHWGRMTHICVGKLSILGSDNGLSPGRRQAIIWTKTGILLIGPLGTNFSEILIGIQTCSFKKMHLKMSSAKWRLLCLGLNELKAMASHGNHIPRTTPTPPVRRHRGSEYNHARTCYLSRALIDQSYMICLKHVTLKHGKVNCR